MGRRTFSGRDGVVLGLVGPFAVWGGWVLMIELFDIPCC